MTEELNELIQDLPEGTAVGTIDSSLAVVGEHTLGESACRRVFESTNTVGQLVEVLGGLDVTVTLNVELIGLELDDEVLSMLESRFKSVDDD